MRPYVQSNLCRRKRWNSLLVRAWYLKESFQLFWGDRQPWRTKQHLLKWMNSAIRSRLEPFRKFVGIAASVARELWHRNNLPYLLLHFDHVTYNGERLSEEQAASYQRLTSPSSN